MHQSADSAVAADCSLNTPRPASGCHRPPTPSDCQVACCEVQHRRLLERCAARTTPAALLSAESAPSLPDPETAPRKRRHEVVAVPAEFRPASEASAKRKGLTCGPTHINNRDHGADHDVFVRRTWLVRCVGDRPVAALFAHDAQPGASRRTTSSKHASTVFRIVISSRASRTPSHFCSRPSTTTDRAVPGPSWPRLLRGKRIGGRLYYGLDSGESPSECSGRGSTDVRPSRRRLESSRGRRSWKPNRQSLHPRWTQAVIVPSGGRPDDIVGAYAAMDQRRAIKSLVRFATSRRR